MAENHKYEYADITELNQIYRDVCMEYTNRLCQQFDMDYNDDEVWWALDKPGETTLCFSDIFSISMSDVKLLVDNNVSYESFIKWWDYNYIMSFAIDNNPTDDRYHYINLDSWLKGYRGQVSEEELLSEEALYWQNHGNK